MGEILIYLPRKVREWYQLIADETDGNVGRLLIQVLINHAVKNGMVCDHPHASTVLYQRGKTFERNGKVIRDPDKMRCTLCGAVWEVKT
jgi:hypothetical protein